MIIISCAFNNYNNVMCYKICNTGVQKPSEIARELELKAGPWEMPFLEYQQMPMFILVVVVGICCRQAAQKLSIIDN